VHTCQIFACSLLSRYMIRAPGHSTYLTILTVHPHVNCPKYERRDATRMHVKSKQTFLISYTILIQVHRSHDVADIHKYQSLNVKFDLEQARKTQWKSRGTALLSPSNLGPRRGGSVKCTSLWNVATESHKAHRYSACCPRILNLAARGTYAYRNHCTLKD